MTLIRVLRCLIAACYLLPTLAYAEAPVQVPSKRAITGAPPLFESQPDRQIPGRFIGFTASGCALSFSAAAVRGLSWNGVCSGGRMQGKGTVIGYDYEQQPVFVFEGYIERGLRNSGAIYEVHRKDGALIGRRIAIIGSALQPDTEVRFLDMPRPFLLALDDWSRQINGENLLASMGATWAPSRQPSASAAQARAFEQEQARKAEQEARETREALGQLIGAIGQYQQNKTDRKQTQQGEQQRQLQEQQEQQRRVQEQQQRASRTDLGRAERIPSSSQPSGRVHNPANEASSCISFFKEKNTSIQIKNNCNYSVAVQWPGGLTNIGPGRSYPSHQQSSFRFFACKSSPGRLGVYQSSEMKQRNEYICPDDW